MMVAHFVLRTAGRLYIALITRQLPADQERCESSLALGLVESRALELMVMNADRSSKRQLSENGKVNLAPLCHPESKKIIFCSDAHSPPGAGIAHLYDECRRLQVRGNRFVRHLKRVPDCGADRELGCASNRYSSERATSISFPRAGIRE